MVGTVTSSAIYPDGRERVIEQGQNLVVSSAYVAMAMAMKTDPDNGGSFLYWALGDAGVTDSVTWDASVADGSAAPLVSDAALTNEIFRKAILPEDIKYLDTNGEVTATPTNRLQITVVFTETEPSDAESVFLREWGIFGATATGVKDSGYMVNRKTHATFEKTPFAQLRRVLEFTI